MAEPAPDEQDLYDPPQRLRVLPSWLAARVARRAQLIVGEALAQEGVRRQHYTVLASLADQGPASQAEIGRRLWIDRSDLHALLGELEADGLVARIRDQRDRRRNVVSLSTAGAKVLERLDRAIAKAQRALLAPLSERDQRELVRLLERVLDGKL
ncbi:MAG: MarR family winged helix-turn-helix transcriptional regulator [Solirubrobacteraceae bacterium]